MNDIVFPGINATAGTSVAVYGSIYGTTNPPPVSSYTIDGIAPVVFTAQSTPTTLVQIPFFQSATLPDGPHTLVVNLTLNTDLWLDFFLYMPSTSPHSVSSGTSKKSNVQAVAGGTTAGVVVLLFCLVLLYLNYRRRRAARKLRKGDVAQKDEKAGLRKDASPAVAGKSFYTTAAIATLIN
jgi:hypothetical protein